ncbi:hypothetical protein CAEBREN_19532 [Caenorhabditis brenneri]|uniref:Zinc finger PHD-type domain-containing protein n=1 Tax=Caenorhabditis brenneri TaxID=135651 RepID=G0PJJ8_CAEBE|nr:hypothetical protein CAEBREN_19532 [Caenorhabditis brenneri]
MAKYYEVIGQDIPIRTLSGAYTTVKRPLARITSLTDVLKFRLSTLSQNSRLFFDDSTGDDISIVLSGDKGGTETKLVLIIENVDKPNNSKAQLLLAFYTGNDDHKSLQNNLADVFIQFNDLQEITYFDGKNDVSRKVKKKLVGDIKLICAFYNHPGPNCLESCFLCYVKYSNHGKNKAICKTFPFEISQALRTLNTYKDEGYPLVELDPVRAILPTLHIFQGTVQKYIIDFFIGYATFLDLGDIQFPESLEDQRQALKELEAEEELYVKRVKTLCEDKDKLNEVVKALGKEKKTERSQKVEALCQSPVCISRIVNQKIVDLKSFRCEECNYTFHFCCEGVVSISERATTQQCHQCKENVIVCKDELIKEVQEKVRNTENMVVKEQCIWEHVNDEKERVLQVFSDFGSDGTMRKTFDDGMKKIGCANYHCSKNLTGNMVRKFLRKSNIDYIVDLFPKSPKLEKIRQLSYIFEKLMSACDSSLKSDYEIDEMAEEVKRMVELIRTTHPEKTISVKLHLFAAHAISCIREHKSFGKSCEQGVEHMHCDFNQLHRLLAPMIDPIAKGFAFVNHFTNQNYLFDRGENWNI